MDSGMESGDMDSGMESGDMDSGMESGDIDSGMESGDMESSMDSGDMDSGMDSGDMMESGMGSEKPMDGEMDSGKPEKPDYGDMESGYGDMGSDYGDMGSGYGGMGMDKPTGGYGGYDEDDMCCPIKRVRGGRMAGIYKLVPRMFIGVHKQTYKPILNKKGYYYFMEKLQDMGGMGGFDKENDTMQRDGSMMGTSSEVQ